MILSALSWQWHNRRPLRSHPHRIILRSCSPSRWWKTHSTTPTTIWIICIYVCCAFHYEKVFSILKHRSVELFWFCFVVIHFWLGSTLSLWSQLVIIFNANILLNHSWIPLHMPHNAVGKPDNVIFVFHHNNDNSATWGFDATMVTAAAITSKMKFIPLIEWKCWAARILGELSAMWLLLFR